MDHTEQFRSRAEVQPYTEELRCSQDTMGLPALVVQISERLACRKTRGNTPVPVLAKEASPPLLGPRKEAWLLISNTTSERANQEVVDTEEQGLVHDNMGQVD